MCWSYSLKKNLCKISFIFLVLWIFFWCGWRRRESPVRHSVETYSKHQKHLVSTLYVKFVSALPAFTLITSVKSETFKGSQGSSPEIAHAAGNKQLQDILQKGRFSCTKQYHWDPLESPAMTLETTPLHTAIQLSDRHLGEFCGNLSLRPPMDATQVFPASSSQAFLCWLWASFVQQTNT